MSNTRSSASSPAPKRARLNGEYPCEHYTRVCESYRQHVNHQRMHTSRVGRKEQEEQAAVNGNNENDTDVEIHDIVEPDCKI